MKKDTFKFSFWKFKLWTDRTAIDTRASDTPADYSWIEPVSLAWYYTASVIMSRKPQQIRFFQRKNTIVISTRSLGEKPKHQDYFKFVLDDLQVDPSDVLGIQLLSTKDLGFIKFEPGSVDAYNDTLRKLGGAGHSYTRSQYRNIGS